MEKTVHQMSQPPLPFSQPTVHKLASAEKIAEEEVNAMEKIVRPRSQSQLPRFQMTVHKQTSAAKHEVTNVLQKLLRQLSLSGRRIFGKETLLLEYVNEETCVPDFLATFITVTSNFWL